jgi:hypothetical protein
MMYRPGKGKKVEEHATGKEAQVRSRLAGKTG